MAIHPAPVIKAHLLARHNWIVVRQGEVEAVPTANRPDGNKRARVAKAGEVDGVTADRELHIQRAVIWCRVEDLDETDIDSLVRKNLHGIDFGAGRVLQISR